MDNSKADARPSRTSRPNLLQQIAHSKAMPLNADQLLAVFPHPVLTKIIGEPYLASITLQQS